MGAEAFHVYYGLRCEVDASNEHELTLLEMRQDSRQLAARKHPLDSWWGVTTDQRRRFLLVGRLIGNFGWENEHAARLDDADITRVTDETKQKLLAAGFDGSPAWHFQFEPGY